MFARRGPNGLYGMPEACRAFATSHQGMPLCISPFRGHAETLSLFVYRAEAHMHCLLRESRNLRLQKKKAVDFLEDFIPRVEMMKNLAFGWCVC